MSERRKMEINKTELSLEDFLELFSYYLAKLGNDMPAHMILNIIARKKQLDIDLLNNRYFEAYDLSLQQES